MEAGEIVMSNEAITYTAQNLTRADLERELDTLWNELRADGATRDAALARGINVDDVPDRRDAISVTTDAAGFTPVETAIIVAFAPVAAKVARDIWEHIILPRIRQRYGQNALEKK